MVSVLNRFEHPEEAIQTVPLDAESPERLSIQPVKYEAYDVRDALYDVLGLDLELIPVELARAVERKTRRDKRVQARNT